MEIHNLEHLDNAIVYGIVNERLRLECDSLDEFLLQFGLDSHSFQQKLDEMDCYYDPVINQLRQK
ncbi:DUF4250 family protein [Enterovibrio nigricans]|uniref:DUF4250 domain-containing protein n=1 Tax=Enterovibrio nigricans DSM 22720 TaxID=1121868 RepID=A0A1T4VLJ3_9GAMM|nr:DUF4250 family protein [Enterovibrio nigricans]PKF49658.1 DUF4250 domain-containing protein [Enterovibrio nigricans]SKA65451.1 protein of unknown function [Enterovibrio nigricans DSM 22720]